MNTFYPFPRLPYELRMQIWEMTVEPRTIHVRAKKFEWKVSSATWGQNAPSPDLFSPTPAPAVLHVCREARNHGLYQMGFSEILNSDGPGIQYIWVNWEIDMIDIGPTDLGYFKAIANSFQLLMFERDFETEYFFYSEGHEVAEFKNLREIHVMCTELCGLYNWIGVFEGGHYWPCGRENMYFKDQSSGRV
ncbi:hypothetical protein P154DRAFT_379813, partial [Amniculicola lignicola CBS 123094]